MRIYNVLNERMEELQAGHEVTVYVCGITPYDTTHLGHAFTYASYDVLIRYLEFCGHTVRFAENVTDIDDDILRKAREVGDDWKSLGNRWTSHFIRDMIALNVRPPDYYPRATDVIDGIVESVEKLLAEGVAYEAGGSVYYDVEKRPTYGELCHMSHAEMLPVANERGNNPDDPNKRHPLDFVLWQAQAPGEPAWDSPWGPGRPGWHIECSTMATRFLADVVDIHGGGGDLIYPHHESEIAQAEPITGKRPFVRYWMHTAMVRHDGEKMSKSLGNLVMAADLLSTCTPDTLRVYLASHHYRLPWSYDEAELAAAAARAEKLGQAAARPWHSTTGAGGEQPDGEALHEFRREMDDDLNTVAALDVMDELADQILAADGDWRPAQDALRQMASVFGLQLDGDVEPRVREGWGRHLKRFE